MITQYPVKIIDLEVLRKNVAAVRATLPEQTQLLAVVKADAYGHGIVPVGRNALDAGASWLAVARTDEGLVLRKAGIQAPILVLGASSVSEIAEGVRHGLTLTVSGPRMIHAVQECAMREGKSGYVHLKIDTGMGRIGVRTEEEVQAVLCALQECPEVVLTGAFTHFADADGEADDYTLMQLNRFRELTASLPEGIIRHCANSAAIHRYPDAAMDMVRLGISMYGYPPVEANCAIKPVMEWHTAVTHVKTVQPGDKISYGCTFTADRTMRAATIACGYGDGYHRAASGQAEVLIGGRRCRILGRICMDQMIADVTDVPDCRPGDRAVLMGRMGSECITAEDIARWAGTIPYEILLAATGRVRRIFEGGGQTDEYSPDNERK